MGKRRDRFLRRQVDQATSRSENGPIKIAERKRREARMLETVKAGKLPYTRSVRNWLSVQLDKPEGKITQEDVQALVQQR
jgi:hypothetical protein